MQAAYNRIKPNVLKAAEKMPDGGLSVQAYGGYTDVCADCESCDGGAVSCVLGAEWETADPKAVPSDTADKATVIAGLKASFAACDTAYAALTMRRLRRRWRLGPVKRSRIGAAWGNVSHDNEQYAELSTYLRLKGWCLLRLRSSLR